MNGQRRSNHTCPNCGTHLIEYDQQLGNDAITFAHCPDNHTCQLRNATMMLDTLLNTPLAELLAIDYSHPIIRQGAPPPVLQRRVMLWLITNPAHIIAMKDSPGYLRPKLVSHYAEVYQCQTQCTASLPDVVDCIWGVILD